MMTSEQNARYYLAHREKLRTRAREYYKTHGEAQREYHRKYYKTMPDNIREKKKSHDRTYYKLHPEKWKEYDLKIRLTHPDRKWDNFCKRRYGISLADYHAIIAKQQGRCLICGEIPKRKLCIDHDHEKDKFRGLICLNCNAGLGLFKDNPKLLQNAIRYLRGMGRKEQER